MNLAIAALLWVLLATTGCTTSVGQFPAAAGTQTSLSQANFRVIQSNARGTSTGFKLLGLIPILAPSYGAAMRDLRSDLPVAGRAAALANVTQDRSNTYFILFSLPRVTITADVIEFLPTGPASPPEQN